MQLKHEISLGDLLHLIAIIVAVITFLIEGATWKKGIEDHLISVDNKVTIANHRISKEDGKIDTLDGKMDNIDERVSKIEGTLSH